MVEKGRLTYYAELPTRVSVYRKVCNECMYVLVVIPSNAYDGWVLRDREAVVDSI